MTTQFGPVLVHSKKLSTSGSVFTVTLKQQEKHTHTLPDTLAGKTYTTPADTYRKVNIRVSLDEAADLAPGSIMPGHIMRTIHVTPVHKGQKEAFAGGYPQAKWMPEYTPDVDLRTQ